MGGTINELNKSKAKAKAEKAGSERDLHETKTALDEAIRNPQSVEKEGKLTQNRISKANQKIDEMG
jgi:hypothetical protein